VTTATDLSTLTGTYTIDAAHSTLGFVARHAMVTKVRGAFNDFEGVAVLDGDDPTKSHAEVTIKAISIDTRNDQRDDHLRSNDFFAMDDYPEIIFVSTSNAQTGTTTFEMTGDLTVKGTTKSVTIPFEYEGSSKDPFGNDRIGFSGSLVINRKDFGVNFNATLETGGLLVSDKITLEFDISAIKNA
jgi:polyisoprenoid-binding protein YceI